MRNSGSQSVRVSCICHTCGKTFYEYPSRIEAGRGKFCCVDCCNVWRRRDKLTKTCKYCGKEFKVERNKGINNRGQFCCVSHRSFYLNNERNNIIKKDEFKKEIKWNRDISYVFGLIASDGCLDSHKNSRIAFNTKDYEQLQNYINIICDNVIGRKLHYKYRLGCYYYYFTSEPFYKFCLKSGLTPRKSLTLGALNIPKEFFPDYLRGELDGDGCIHKALKRRKNGEIYYNLSINFYGSKDNLQWIKDKIGSYYNIKGSNVLKRINEIGTCYSISYAHYASIALAKIIYKDAKYFLSRKKEKAKFFIKDL